MFAAVGLAVDNVQDACSRKCPSRRDHPALLMRCSSSLMTPTRNWPSGSIIPFTCRSLRWHASPTTFAAEVAFVVVLYACSCDGGSAKIYRAGIFRYGRNRRFKELFMDTYKYRRRASIKNEKN